MSSTLIANVGELVTNTDSETGDATSIGDLGLIRGAAVVVEDGITVWIGSALDAPPTDDAIDLGGACLIPSFVDSHTHIVFAGDRSAEFSARMAGAPYTGGGISSTVADTRAAQDSELRAVTARLVDEARNQGTGTLEIKSGYGLTVHDEQRLLRIAHEFTEETTFLGGHVVPPEYREAPDDYVDLVAGEMLEACAPYSKWADVFCEPNSPVAFDAEQSREILSAARSHGLGLRVHGAQLGIGPGPALAVEFHAASLDHATFLTDEDLDALAQASMDSQTATTVTFLPIVEFSTRQPFPDARRVVDRGIPTAIASDCNPGTCYSNSMPLAIAFAVRDMHMTAQEALWAATAGGAHALRRTDLGRIAEGLPAAFTTINAPHVEHLAYRPGVPLSTFLTVSRKG